MGRPDVHGHFRREYRSPTYYSWSSMIQRTPNPNAPNYAEYGGSGRTVCKRWQGRTGFAHFLADMGERPEGTTLERIKNNLGYSPANCKWGDTDTQQNNKKSSKTLTHKRRTQTVAQWARELGINVQTIHKRLRLGWPTARALSASVDESKRNRYAL